MKNFFLQQFNEVQPGDWEVVEEGRAGVLRLRGQQGSLDIHNVYLETGGEGRRSRQRTLDKLRTKCSPRNKVLNVLAGDFNFVGGKEDRFNKDSGQFVGEKDEDEQKDFHSKCVKAMEFCEWDQQDYTCETGQVKSRIDRILSNHFQSDRLDHDFTCGNHAWENKISMHRHIFFKKSPGTGSFNQINNSTSKVSGHEEWQHRVLQLLKDKRTEDQASGNAIDDLIRCKRAITEASEQMLAEGKIQAEDEAEDELGWVLRCVKAVVKVQVSRMDRCIQAVPWIGQLITPGDPAARDKPGFTRFKSRAFEIATKRVADLLNDLTNNAELDERVRSCKRGEAAKIIRRLTPGGGGSKRMAAEQISPILSPKH